MISQGQRPFLYQRGATPHVTVTNNHKRQRRGSQCDGRRRLGWPRRRFNGLMERAFSPCRFAFGHLGRCPRLVWGAPLALGRTALRLPEATHRPSLKTQFHMTMIVILLTGWSEPNDELPRLCRI